jgi:hypothetical protein
LQCSRGQKLTGGVLAHARIHRTFATEINEIRPQYKQLEAELASVQEQAHMYRAAKEEAEAKLAQVNARLGSASRRAPLELTHGGMSPAGSQWRPDVHGQPHISGGGGEYGYRGGRDAGGGHDVHTYAGSHEHQQRGAPADYYGAPPSSRAHAPGLGEPPPHVNKRLKPGFDASPRAWGRRYTAPLGTPDEAARGGAPHAVAMPMSMHGLLNPNATPMASPIHMARGHGGGAAAQGDAATARLQRPPGSPMSLLTGRPRGSSRGGGSLYGDN